MSKRRRPKSFTISIPSFVDESNSLNNYPEEPASAKKVLQMDAQTASPTVEFHCHLPPHKGQLTFYTHGDYEVHYIKEHTNRCTECGKNFPTQHILGLHIEETHDPVVQAKRDRGETNYGCFVEGCDRRCSDPRKRRLHCIDKHLFPRNYDFRVINHGIDHWNSMLYSKRSQKRRLSNAPKHRQGWQNTHITFPSSPEPAGSQGNFESVNQMQPEPQSSSSTDFNDLTMDMAALRFVPTSLTIRRPG